MKRADRLGARLALILGEDELAREACVLKRMADGSQEEVSLQDVPDRAAALLAADGSADEGSDDGA